MTGSLAGRFAADRKLLAVIVAASLAIFSVELDFFAVQAAVPQMADDLDTTATALQWVVSGYVLATASFLIVAGRLADLRGRRTWLIVGAVVFGGASLVAGAATSAEMVIGARVVQGVGGAILFPVGLAVVTNAFRGPLVERALGTVFAVGSIGQGFGPLIGGFITDAASWRWVLWINVPIAAVVIVLTMRGVANSRDDTVPPTIDWAGLFLVVLSIASFTYGIDRAADWGWTAPSTLAYVGAGLLGLVLFVVTELRVRYPLLDLRLFRIKEFTVMTSAGAIGNGGALVVIFLAMVWLQDVEGLDAARAGVAFLSFSLGYALASVLSGRVERIPSWVVITVGLVCGGAGIVGMASSSQLAVWSVFGLFAGFGVGVSWAYTSVVTQSLVPPEQAGEASGTVLTILVGIGGVALAVAVSIFDTHSPPGAGNEAAVIDGIFYGTGVILLAAAALVVLLGRNPRTVPPEEKASPAL